MKHLVSLLSAKYSNRKDIKVENLIDYDNCGELEGLFITLGDGKETDTILAAYPEDADSNENTDWVVECWLRTSYIKGDTDGQLQVCRSENLQETLSFINKICN